MPKDSQNICDELKSTVVCRDSHIKFGKALLSFAHWNSMNPLYHGTTHNKYSPTEWNTNSLLDFRESPLTDSLLHYII